MKRISAALTCLAATLVTCFSGNAFAQSLDKLSGCTALTEDRVRLKCYDEEMARLGLKPRAVTAPAAVSPAAPAATATKRQAAPEDFGLQGELLRRKKAAENPEVAPLELTARVKTVSERALGELRIELDNGQVWVETEKHNGAAVVAGEAITLKPGRLGSYFLTRQSGPALRVKRVQ